MSPSRRSLTAAALAIAAAAAGCGEDRPGRPSTIRVEHHGTGPHAVALLRDANSRLTCDAKRTVGRLVVRNGCLLLEGVEGSLVAGVWQPGATVTVEAGGIRVGQSEAARVGDWIEIGGSGGTIPRPEGWPQDCPTQTEQVCGFSVWTEAEQVEELGRTAEEQARRLAAGLPLHEPGFQPPYQPPPLPGP